jgi:hypothetical protein
VFGRWGGNSVEFSVTIEDKRIREKGLTEKRREERVANNA